jgi:putative endonuclease
MSSVGRGKQGERLAESFLVASGYEILAKNWRGLKGRRAPEIDIIAREKDIIVFVEVKAASTDSFGSPAYWITENKRRRLANGATAYLSQHSLDQANCRFDAILIDARSSPPTVKHIKNAFDVPNEMP